MDMGSRVQAIACRESLKQATIAVLALIDFEE
jgi:hypothetical protein